jgi:hypothetical protein
MLGLGHMLGVGLWWAAAAPLSAQLPEPSEPTPALQTPSLSSQVAVEAGVTCLDRERLIERIERWRQHASVDPNIRVQVRGDAALATRVFFSVVRVGTQPTERVLDNAPVDCDQLHSAVALSIALAIDAILSADRGVLVPPAPAQARNDVLVKPALRRPANGPAMYLELGLLGGTSVGVVTNLAAAALPRLQFAPLPWLAFALAGIATHDGRATISGSSGEFSASVVAGGVDACAGGETLERLSFFMCAGVRGGVFVTDGTAASDGYRRTLRWWSIAASGQARAWIVPSVAIGISVEALFALAARDLIVDGTSAGLPPLVRTMPRVGLSIAAGPVFRFF